jgi:hypothetical protein
MSGPAMSRHDQASEPPATQPARKEFGAKLSPSSNAEFPRFRVARSSRDGSQSLEGWTTRSPADNVRRLWPAIPPIHIDLQQHTPVGVACQRGFSSLSGD